VPQLDTVAANALLSSGGWSYLDVRTKEEVADGHAPSVVNVPVILHYI
jgi:rhodanese-related sulfurtransferase